MDIWSDGSFPSEDDLCSHSPSEAGLVLGKEWEFMFQNFDSGLAFHWFNQCLPAGVESVRRLHLVFLPLPHAGLLLLLQDLELEQHLLHPGDRSFLFVIRGEKLGDVVVGSSCRQLPAMIPG